MNQAQKENEAMATPELAGTTPYMIVVPTIKVSQKVENLLSLGSRRDGTEIYRLERQSKREKRS